MGKPQEEAKKSLATDSSRLEIIVRGEKVDFKTVKQYIAGNGETYLLGGLLDSRADGTPIIFLGYLKTALPFYKQIYDEMGKQKLDEKGKAWFDKYQKFYNDLTYYSSPEFEKEYANTPKPQREQFMANLTNKIARQLDSLSESNHATSYVHKKTSDFRVNIGGAMVPLSVIKDEDAKNL